VRPHPLARHRPPRGCDHRPRHRRLPVRRRQRRPVVRRVGRRRRRPGRHLRRRHLPARPDQPVGELLRLRQGGVHVQLAVRLRFLRLGRPLRGLPRRRVHVQQRLPGLLLLRHRRHVRRYGRGVRQRRPGQPDPFARPAVRQPVVQRVDPEVRRHARRRRPQRVRLQRRQHLRLGLVLRQRRLRPRRLGRCPQPQALQHGVPGPPHGVLDRPGRRLRVHRRRHQPRAVRRLHDRRHGRRLHSHLWRRERLVRGRSLPRPVVRAGPERQCDGDRVRLSAKLDPPRPRL
ncbi:uncharacterized protein RHOBADRAFT_52063, partial [Rhodotorula graminis WP1]